MNRRSIRAWKSDIPYEQTEQRVYFVLPDTFFDVSLHTCTACGALFGLDEEAARYGLLSREKALNVVTCPQCGVSPCPLAAYPETFVGHDGACGHFSLPRDYPPDADLVSVDVWDLSS
jgi:hypothetical protein